MTDTVSSKLALVYAGKVSNPITSNPTYLSVVIQYLSIAECFQSFVLLSKYHHKLLTSPSNFFIFKQIMKTEFGSNFFTSHIKGYSLLPHLYDICRSPSDICIIFLQNWTLNAWIYFTKKWSIIHKIPANRLTFSMIDQKFKSSCVADDTKEPVYNEAYYMYISSNFLFGILNSSQNMERMKQQMIDFVRWLQMYQEWKLEDMRIWRYDFIKLWVVFNKLEDDSSINKNNKLLLYFDLLCIAFDDEFMNFNVLYVEEEANIGEFMHIIGDLIVAIHRRQPYNKPEMYIAESAKHLKGFILHFKSELIIDIFNQFIKEFALESDFLEYFIVASK